MGDLRTLQAEFYALVTAPESVSATLAQQGRGPGALQHLVVGDARLSAVERLEIYANMYFFRLLDVLRDAYPRVVSAIGDVAFHNLVTAYLAACRPAHPSIAQAGDRLAAFIAQHPMGREKPWLAPLARVERLHVELFDGPDAQPLTLTRLRQLGADALADLTLTLIPCFETVSHPFAIAELWGRLERGEGIEEVPAGPETMVIWRDDVTVFHRRLDDDEARLLQGVRRGITVAALCEVAGEGRPIDEAARRVFTLISRWSRDGLLQLPVG